MDKKQLRTARINAEIKDLQTRLRNNGYLPGKPYNPDHMDDQCKEWQDRLWYLGYALTHPDVYGVDL